MFTTNNLQNHRFDSNFYQQKTLKIAKDLLGTYLICTKNGSVQIGQITETEAYIGQEDKASHARFGITSRNKIMWETGGSLYIYLIYGMHHMLNIITESKNSPAAVLIRSLKPIQNINTKTDGPGKICRALNITTKDTGIDLSQSQELFIADLGSKPKKIICTPRVGISYTPEPWLSKPWRFISIQTPH